MQTIDICKGLRWEAVQTADSRSFFPEATIGKLADIGIAHALTTGNIAELQALLGDRINTDGTADVRPLRHAPDVVVRQSDTPFSYTALNAALEAGWQRSPQYGTPTHYGFMESDDGTKLTIMSAVNGSPLNQLPRSKQTPEVLERMRSRIQASAHVALKNVGVDPGTVIWDLNTANMFQPGNARNWSDAEYAPITIIDQGSQLWADSIEWMGQIAGHNLVDQLSAVPTDASQLVRA